MVACKTVSFCAALGVALLLAASARADPAEAIASGLKAMRGGDFKQAETEFTVALDDARASRLQRSRAYAYRGSSRLRLQDHKTALADFNKSLELERGDPWALSERCWAYRGLGRPKLAIDDANRAMLRRPGLANAYRCRARVYFDEAQYELAAQDFSQIIQTPRLSKPARARAFRDRGDALFRMARYAKASEDFAAALAIEPLHAGAHAARCRALALAGMPTDGLRHCARALELDPDNLVALDSQGLAHFLAGDTGPAIRIFTTILKRDPKAWYAHYHRAMAHEAAGNAAAAERDFADALKIAPAKADFDKKAFRLKPYRKTAS